MGDDTEPPKARFEWITPALIAVVLTSSLAAAVFSWWVTHEDPLVVGYNISTTSTGNDVRTKSLVPGLSLRIGAKEIPAIYTHVISISRTKGYADSIDFAATFERSTETFGSAFEAPSPAHLITCEIIAAGTKCNLEPMDGQGEYRVSLATDNATPPKLTITGARDIQLASLAEIASRSSGWKGQGWVFPLLTGLIVVWTVLVGHEYHRIVKLLTPKRRAEDDRRSKM